jgi:hypothetical protein
MEMNNKFSIGVVIAIVLQVSAFVWWTAQQAQTIDQLKGEVEELTARTEVEKEVTLINNVEQLKKDIEELNQKTLDAILETNERIDNLASFVNSQDKLINDTFAEQMAEENEKTVNTFAIVEGWIDEIDDSIDDLYYQIETMGETQ